MRAPGFDQVFRLMVAVAIDDELAVLEFDNREVVDWRRA
jgi:hypothetical protein